MKYTLLIILMVSLSAKAIIDDRPILPPVTVTPSNQAKHGIKVEIENGEKDRYCVNISIPPHFENAKFQSVYFKMEGKDRFLSAPLRFFEENDEILAIAIMDKKLMSESTIEIVYENKNRKYRYGHCYAISLRAFLEQKNNHNQSSEPTSPTPVD